MGRQVKVVKVYTLERWFSNFLGFCTPFSYLLNPSTPSNHLNPIKLRGVPQGSITSVLSVLCYCGETFPTKGKQGLKWLIDNVFWLENAQKPNFNVYGGKSSLLISIQYNSSVSQTLYISIGYLKLADSKAHKKLQCRSIVLVLFMFGSCILIMVLLCSSGGTVTTALRETRRPQWWAPREALRETWRRPDDGPSTGARSRTSGYVCTVQLGCPHFLTGDLL